MRERPDPLHVRQPAGGDPRAQLARELPLADQHEAERLVPKQLGGAQDDVGAVERAPLAVLQHDERLAGGGARAAPSARGSGSAPTGATASRSRASPNVPLVVRGVRPGVGQHQRRQTEGHLVDRADGGRLGPAGAHQAAVAGKCVQERDQRVEDQLRAAEGGEQPPEGHQEVPGVPDDHGVDVEAAAVLGQQPHVCLGNARSEACRPAGSRHLRRGQRRQRGVELVHLDAVLAETGDEHGVARVVRLVRPEVRDGPGVRSTCGAP